MGELKVIIDRSEGDYSYSRFSIDRFTDPDEAPSKRLLADNLLVNDLGSINTHVLTTTGPGVEHHLETYWCHIARDSKMVVHIVEKNWEVFQTICSKLEVMKSNWNKPENRTVRVTFDDIVNVKKVSRFVDADLMATYSTTRNVFKTLLRKQASYPYRSELKKVFIGTISKRDGCSHLAVKELLSILGCTIEYIYRGEPTKLSIKRKSKGRSWAYKENVEFIEKGSRVDKVEVYSYGDGTAMLTWRIVYH